MYWKQKVCEIIYPVVLPLFFKELFSKIGSCKSIFTPILVNYKQLRHALLRYVLLFMFRFLAN